MIGKRITADYADHAERGRRERGHEEAQKGSKNAARLTLQTK
jgi:hypothetical protein